MIGDAWAFVVGWVQQNPKPVVIGGLMLFLYLLPSPFGSSCPVADLQDTTAVSYTADGEVITQTVKMGGIGDEAPAGITAVPLSNEQKMTLNFFKEAASPHARAVFAEELDAQATEESGGNAVSRLPSWSPSACKRLAGEFAAAADKHSVDIHLLHAMAIQESGCGCHNNTGEGNIADARGVMQIVPRWHPEYDVSRTLDHGYNIDYGASFISDLMSKHGPDDAIGRYNGGGNHWGKSESQSYRHFVQRMWAEGDDDYSPAFEQWKRAGGYKWLKPEGWRLTEGCTF